MQVVFHGRDSTGSEQFERIDIECPANPSCLGQGFDGRQPLLEQPVQRPTIAAFDQKLSVVTIGTSGHGRRGGSEQANPSALTTPAGLSTSSERFCCTARLFEKADGGLCLDGRRA
jgi:hypothetical protein